MARPRRLSGILLGFVAVFAWLGTSGALAMGFDPLTDEFLASGSPLPMWLPLAMSSVLMLAATLLSVGAIYVGWFAKVRPPPTARLVAAALLLLGWPVVVL